jgi:hypothetical protein
MIAAGGTDGNVMQWCQSIKGKCFVLEEANKLSLK